MSEQLDAAAAALGLPEALVKRSAEARATETGATVDEILAAWAGGGRTPAATTPPTEPARGEETGDVPPSEGEPTEQEVEEAPSISRAREAPGAPPTAPPSPGPSHAGPPTHETAALPYKPPILVGPGDNPVKVLAGVLGLFLLVLLVGLIGPSVPTDNPGERSSEIAFSSQAEQGRSLYLTLGCSACHTQMVRPVIADVGLGAVTLNDTNQVLGSRRFGPDLANVGTRMTTADLASVISGAGGHPTHNLRVDHIDALVAYLSESVTIEAGGS